MPQKSLIRLFLCPYDLTTHHVAPNLSRLNLRDSPVCNVSTDAHEFTLVSKISALRQCQNVEFPRRVEPPRIEMRNDVQMLGRSAKKLIRCGNWRWHCRRGQSSSKWRNPRKRLFHFTSIFRRTDKHGPTGVSGPGLLRSHISILKIPTCRSAGESMAAMPQTNPLLNAQRPGICLRHPSIFWYRLTQIRLWLD